MKKLYLDTETFSPTSIKAGTYKYAESAQVLLVTYALDGGEVQCWDTQYPIPLELYTAAQDEERVIVCHNVPFDRVLLEETGILGPDIHLPPERFYCTLQQATSIGLPGSLDMLCKVFKLGEDDAKIDGKKFIQLFSKPNKTKGRNDASSHPEEWAAFIEYAKRDIVSMRKLHSILPSWNFKHGGLEHELWCDTVRMNDRGFAIDGHLVHSAMKLRETLLKMLAEDSAALTEGEVPSATQVALFKHYTKQVYGYELPDVKSSTIDLLLGNPDIPAPLRELLMLRREASRTASTKFGTLVHSMSHDQRMRGTIVFNGAGRTGRDAGRIFQPQNLMRPAKYVEDADAQEEAIVAVKHGALALLYDKPMEVLASVVRGSITAGRDKKLVISDLSNIEGRVLVWLAGEDWKLDYFRDYDAGKIRFDNYVAAYAKAFDMPIEDVGSAERQLGKVLELACGYGGGVGGFLTFATLYRVDLDQMADAVYRTGTAQGLSKAEGMYDWAVRGKRTLGLERRHYVACEYLKQAWRDSHPNTVTFWSALEMAWRQATVHNKTEFPVGRCTFYRHDKWMTIKLPSGRRLTYTQPTADGSLTFVGVNSFTRKWGRISTYGGKLAENITQAVARDVMMYNAHKLNGTRYDIVLRVHDELVTETPNLPKFNADHLGSVLASKLDWCQDLPLAAAGFEAYRYRKD